MYPGYYGFQFGSFFGFIINVLIFIFLLNLLSRVRKLEQISRGKTLEDKSSHAEAKHQGETKELPLSSSDQKTLLKYIHEELENGSGREEIEEKLIQNGWKSADITHAFSYLPAQAEGVDNSGSSSALERFINWCREDWLLKLGALLLLIGFGWFATYAFLNNWIGPVGRITLGIIAGTIFILIGERQIRKYVNQGGIFLVLGSTIILLTVFAAREIYDFFTPLSALGLMFLSTVFVSFASVRYKSRELALAGLILASIAPLLTGAGPQPNYITVFSYLFVVILGVVWTVVLTGKRELTAAALIIVSFYSLSALSSSTADREILLLFAYAFSGVFFLTNSAGLLRLKGKEILPDILTAAANGIFLLVWILAAAQEEWKSLIISAWMIVFVLGAFMIYRTTQKREPFYIYAGTGVVMLGAATAVELSGPALTMAYTIEAGIVLLTSLALLKDAKIAARTSLLFAVPVFFSLSSIFSNEWKFTVFHQDFFSLIVLSLTLFMAGLCLTGYKKETKEAEVVNVGNALIIIGSFYAYILIWLSAHAVLAKDSASMLSLVIYTIVGLVTYIYGSSTGKRLMRLYGGALIAFVVGRLFLVEIWDMELQERIITFFMIGVLLISTAFLSRRKPANADVDKKY